MQRRVGVGVAACRWLCFVVLFHCVLYVYVLLPFFKAHLFERPTSIGYSENAVVGSSSNKAYQTALYLEHVHANFIDKICTAAKGRAKGVPVTCLRDPPARVARIREAYAFKESRQLSDLEARRRRKLVC